MPDEQMIDDTIDNDEAALETYADPAPPAPRTKKKRNTDSDADFMATEAASAKARSSQEMDLDEYMSKWDWNDSSMRCSLKRLAPNRVPGFPTDLAGHLETRDGGWFTIDEIKQRYGGGTFQVTVQGYSAKHGRTVPLGNKRFQIAGAPNLDTLPLPAQLDNLNPRRGGGNGGDNVAPQAQAALVGLVGDAFNKALEGRNTSGEGINPDLFREVRESVENAARQSIETVKEAASVESRNLREQLNGLREETTSLRAELQARQQQTESAVQAARGESHGLLGTLLPHFAQSADQRATDSIRDAREHIARMQDQYARDVSAAEQRYAMQLENAKTMFTAQSLNQQTMFDGRVQQLNGDLQFARQRIELLETENKGLRDRVTELLVEQGKKHDPMNILQQAAGLKEAAEGLLGGGGGGDGGLDDGASNVEKMIFSGLQTLQGFAPAIAAKLSGQPQQAAPQQLTPQQQQMLAQQHAMQQHQQALAQQQAMVLHQQAQGAPQMGAPPRIAAPRSITPQPAQRPTGPRARLRRSDLATGVELLNSALAAGLPPERAADAAAQTIDRDTLKELVRRKPIAVYNSLQANGILDGQLASVGGEQYLTAFLRALRTRLSGTRYDPTNQPPEAVAVEEVLGSNAEEGNDEDDGLGEGEPR